MLNQFCHVRLCAILWTIARQAPLSMEFSRQEYWSGLPCPPPGDLPDPEAEPTSLAAPALQANCLPLRHQGSLRLCLLLLFSHVQLFVTPWTATCQASLSLTISQILLKLMFIESVMPSNSSSPLAFNLSQHQCLF